MRDLNNNTKGESTLTRVFITFLTSSFLICFWMLISKMSLYTILDPLDLLQTMFDGVSTIGDEGNNPVPFLTRLTEAILPFLTHISFITWALLALTIYVSAGTNLKTKMHTMINIASFKSAKSIQ